jgi:hypothetical protein
MKKIFFGLLISFIQAMLWSICLLFKYVTLEPNYRLIIGTIFPILIIVFFIIGLLQNISIYIQKKWFSFTYYFITIIFLIILFCFPLHKYYTFLFFILTITILMIPKLNYLKLK